VRSEDRDRTRGGSRPHRPSYPTDNAHRSPDSRGHREGRPDSAAPTWLRVGGWDPNWARESSRDGANERPSDLESDGLLAILLAIFWEKLRRQRQTQRTCTTSELVEHNRLGPCGRAESHYG
jgi:hypothetical protein